jgi:hypothetical protein
LWKNGSKMTISKKMNQKITDNKRKRLRIPFESQVLLKFKELGAILEAKMKNISINGIFVETSIFIPIHTPCDIEIVITAPHSKLTMQIEGFVSRQDPNGLGIQFINDMEWFAFFSIFQYYGRQNTRQMRTTQREPANTSQSGEN